MISRNRGFVHIAAWAASDVALWIVGATWQHPQYKEGTDVNEQGAKVIITARRAGPLEEAAADHPEVKACAAGPSERGRELASHEHRWEERR